jgi:hypothetical protein
MQIGGSGAFGIDLNGYRRELDIGDYRHEVIDPPSWSAGHPYDVGAHQ